MTREKLLLACSSLLFLLFGVCNCITNDQSNPPCVPSSCGNIHNISFPFRLTSDPPGCGSLDYELSCEENSTVLNLREGKFIVKAINYHNYTIRVVDSGFDEEDCSSLPRFRVFLISFYMHSFTPYEEVNHVKVIKCVKPVNSSAYLDANPCFQQLEDGFYRYAYVGEMCGTDLREGCSIEATTLVQLPGHSILSFTEIHRQMAFGFELFWSKLFCPDKCGSVYYCSVKRTGVIRCTLALDELKLATFQEVIRDYAYPFWFAMRDLLEYITDFFGRHYSVRKILQEMRVHISENEQARYWPFHASALIVLYVAGRTLCGAPIAMAFIIYKWSKRHLSGYQTIEEFLNGENNAIMPIRYAYSDIKKMTEGFKEMLGKGGFGSVYKGKLRSGQFAAVKILETTKSKGQDFINEVATIGRIHHANVVRLIGYCSQGSKNALVYEFMSNGSLDAHIFNRERSIALSWEKLYKISLGIARGIEYLHQGCDVQILHFDIKPHNILLDENFTPKISDFGLAKFYPKMDNIATLTAAKGTIGYMAPELFYKNIGRVSYKADVYSFGMLLLEMAGKRKNLKVPTGAPSDASLSQIYYPFVVYDKLVDGNLEIEDATDEENKMVRKMIITGLWCIQMQPSDRPSMSKVVEMLEGNLEDLSFPSRPLKSPVKSTQTNKEESSFISQIESTQTNEKESSSYATCKSALSSNKTDENPNQLD